MLMTEFDLEIISQKYIKGQAIIDQLIDAPLPYNQLPHEYFPNESINNINETNFIPFKMTLFFNGAKFHEGGGDICYYTSLEYSTSVIIQT